MKMTKNFDICKTKILRMNSKTFAITFVILLTLSVLLITLPAATAQTSTKQTYAFLGCVPNPSGVGQGVLLHVGITEALSNVNMGYEDLSVSIIDPEGKESSINDIQTDSTGGTGQLFTPTMAGTYHLQTHFPEQTITMIPRAGDPYDVTYLASESKVLELEILPEPIDYYTPQPLPSEYWTRPINAQFREWSTIAGNWLGGGPGGQVNVVSGDSKFAPYNDNAPETGHILWTKPIATGGLAGGSMGNHAIECGAAYEAKFADSVVLNGVLYYNQYEANGGTNAEQVVVAVDLHTGEELWTRNWNNTRLSFGQLFYFDSYNYHGVFAYLWTKTGSTWNAYDAFTGRWEYSMTNVPSGTTAFGPKGEIYIATVNVNNGWMTLWNSSRVVSDHGSWGSKAVGVTLDAARGIEWNKTIPTELAGSVTGFVVNEKVVGASVTTDAVKLWAFSLEPGHEGTLLYDEVWDAPSEWADGNLTVSWGRGMSLLEGVGTVWVKETMQWYGFSLETGDYLWGPTAPEHYLAAYGVSAGIAYGRLFTCFYDGIVNCYDLQTGDPLWEYEVRDPLNEILWSNNWPMFINFIADGKIYLIHGEHSPVDPKPRGGPIICIDVETGKEVWSMSMYFYYSASAVIGDSVAVVANSYDQQVYAIGKGPSATTVTASPKVAVQGNSVLIEGTVLDVSPGTDATDLTLRFPNGVPVVADDDMSKWMEYVYMQFERPADATGVTVKLEAIDPNGNYQNLGTTTSDSYGNYGFAFEPEVEGTYTIIATFEGSKAYYGSTSTTYMTVDPAASASTPIEPDTETPDTQTADTETPDTETPDTETPDTETPATEAPLISTELAIIATVAVACVIGVAAFWALRKRK
ncbi:MAG: hypothetical protein CW691_01990 [Candidatus Bathyarchaeum sp.]|nr:MAG: hypothetical protein CW691_01990 [Candidatus Bathyarchaeum sp.]